MAKKDDTPASDLERRKQVKLRVRSDLAIAPQKYEGRTYYVVKDPVSLRYYRFKEQEHFLIQLMDGKHSLDDAQKEFEKRFRPDRLTLEDLEHFGQQLLTAGLAQNESPQAGKQLFDRRKKRKRSELMQTLTNILYIKIPVFDPERLLIWMLNRLVPWLGHAFNAALVLLTLMMLPAWGLWIAAGLDAFVGRLPAPERQFWFMPLNYVWGGIVLLAVVRRTIGLFAGSFLIMLAAVVLVLTHFQTFYDRLPEYHEFFSFKTVIYLWVALGVVKVIHEFGHGLSCKLFGGEVHEMGLLFLCLSPCMYCNVSDAWTLPNKWKRIIISGAGIYVELMIAAIATFVWWNTPSHPFVNYMALSLMVVCSVSTVVFNGNPLMRYDGYYVLADWLEIPNLRDRSNRYLQRLAMEYCLGIEVQPEPYMALWRRVLFVTYAVVSWVYRWVVTFVILKFMASFLKPYKLEVISTMLAAFAAGSMIGWPLYRLGKNIYKRGRLPDMKPVRVTVSAAVVAAVLLGFFFLPLPVSRVRQSGVVDIQPEYARKVFVEVSSRLDKVHVREGEIVKKGTILAEFSSQGAQAKEEYEKVEYNRCQRLIDAYRAALLITNNPNERKDLKRKVGQCVGEMEKHKQSWEMFREEFRARMVLRAPCDGVIMGLPKPEEVGKTWDVGKWWETGKSSEKELGLAFCTIGDPNKLRILVPVSPDDYELVRSDRANRQAHGEKVPVTIRIQGRAAQTWSGEVAYLRQSEAKYLVDREVVLSNKAGGPLAIRPTSDPKKPEPQSQVYLLDVNIDHPDGAIVPGVMAQVKIHCEYRSCAWWTWRAISSTFDLGLL